MSNIVIGVGVSVLVLVWGVARYYVAVKKQQRKARAKQLKDEKYKRVLEKARLAEHQEKVFKAQTGHIPSQLSLAKEYELTNVREAIGWYVKAAELDNDIAQNSLARLCRLDSRDPDGEAKSQYWERVVRAKGKEPEALFELGCYQVRGYGTEVDTEAGIGNITAAGEAGYPAAQLFLGDWYVAEASPEKAPLQAFAWRIRAAAGQDAKGCIKTAFCYQAGIGVAKDQARAIYWLERGAELGSAEAQFLAAKMHLGGDANDAAIAYIWFSLAQASGHRQAKAERDQTVQYVGVESIYAVQRIANSVYKILKHPPVPPHAAIELLDRIYSRQRYRPTAETLAALAAGEFTDGIEPAVETDVREEQAEQHQDEPAVHGAEPEQGGVPAGNMPPDDELPASAAQHVAAAREYQQLNWAASWDDFGPDSDKPGQS